MFLKKVECSGIIERKEMFIRKKRNKQWVRSESIFHGYVIGERTLSNGYIDRSMMSSDYKPIKYFKAYIVVFNIHRKPVYVLPEDVKIIE